MKRIFLLLAFIAFFASTASAQTEKEIIGQWKLVSGKDASGKAIDIKAMHKSETVFNIFKAGGVYLHVSGAKVDTGTWKLSPDGKEFTVSVNNETTVWKFVSFSPEKAVVTGSSGTMEFVKFQ